MARLPEISKNDAELRSISYGPDGSWVLLLIRLPSHTTECQDLAKVLDGAISRHTPVRWVTFVRDDWLCLTADGFFTSNESLAVSKLIAQSYRDGRAPKWVAVDTSIKLSNSTK